MKIEATELTLSIDDEMMGLQLISKWLQTLAKNYFNRLLVEWCKFLNSFVGMILSI